MVEGLLPKHVVASAAGSQYVQKLIAFLVPFVAILYGLVALRATSHASRTDRTEATPWFAKAGPILLVCYGALTINNLALARVIFLGSEMLGYGARYALVDSLAGGCLFLAALAWAHAAVSRARAPAGALDPTTTRSIRTDLKVIGLQVLGLAVLLVVVGVFMEYLRNAHLLPWTAP